MKIIDRINKALQKWPVREIGLIKEDDITYLAINAETRSFIVETTLKTYQVVIRDVTKYERV